MMNYIGYDFYLTERGIGLDEELNLDRLGWKGGDYFRLENINGRAMLRRIDPVEKFLQDGITAIVNEEEDTVRFVTQEQHQQEVIQILGKDNG